MTDITRQQRLAFLLGIALLSVTASLMLLGASVGSTGLESVSRIRFDPLALQIVWDIRLPRTVGAWLAGALLGLAGAVAQGLFRNPLADPYLLGSASGASLGVALAMVLLGALPVTSALAPWLVHLGLTGAAFIGAVAAVLLTLALARGVQHTLRLLLAGVVVGVVLGALGSLTMLLSPEVMQTLQVFIVGSTAFVDWTACALMAGVLLPCLIVAWAFSHVLDGLSLGEATAASLGLPVSSMRAALVVVLALATGTAVAQTGLIGFVGLAAPHLVRSVAKTTHGRLIFLSSLMGGVLLTAADTLARWLLAPQELPVGVLTAVLGGGYLAVAHAPAGQRGAAAMNPIAIHARSLTASLGNVEVLHGIELALPAGRWTSIVGPNGAGKSTLLKVLAHLLPYEGGVELLGQSLATLGSRARARQLAWLGQSEVAGDDLTVFDVAMLGRLPHQSWLAPPSAADLAAVEQALRATQAWDWRGRTLGQLSGGERQRVLLARALAVQAQVLLMDEPLANLDPPHQVDWLLLVRELVAQGKTVISVLHELSLALQADEMVIMADGQVHHQGACADPATHRALERVFEHRIAIHALAGQYVALPRP